jgi:hypothetical protein
MVLAVVLVDPSRSLRRISLVTLCSTFQEVKARFMAAVEVQVDVLSPSCSKASTQQTTWNKV